MLARLLNGNCPRASELVEAPVLKPECHRSLAAGTSREPLRERDVD